MAKSLLALAAAAAFVLAGGGDAPLDVNTKAPEGEKANTKAPEGEKANTKAPEGEKANTKTPAFVPGGSGDAPCLHTAEEAPPPAEETNPEETAQDETEKRKSWAKLYYKLKSEDLFDEFYLMTGHDFLTHQSFARSMGWLMQSGEETGMANLQKEATRAEVKDFLERAMECGRAFHEAKKNLAQWQEEKKSS